jgi:hypothetical protein
MQISIIVVTKNSIQIMNLFISIRAMIRIYLWGEKWRNIPSFTEWKYSYHCTNKNIHDLFYITPKTKNFYHYEQKCTPDWNGTRSIPRSWNGNLYSIPRDANMLIRPDFNAVLYNTVYNTNPIKGFGCSFPYVDIDIAYWMVCSGAIFISGDFLPSVCGRVDYFSHAYLYI